MPPRVDWAERHGKASMIGTPSIGTASGMFETNEASNVCPCCGKTSVIFLKNFYFIIFKLFNFFLEFSQTWNI